MTINRNQRIAIYAVFFSCLVWILSYIKPGDDDWYYFTTPMFRLSWEDLRPESTFWRPMDVIFGRILGFVPGWFPLLNHIVVALGHTVSLYALSVLLKRFEIDKSSRLISLLFFAISPGVLATVLSIDSINQTYALCFGAIGTLIYLKNSNIKGIAGWLLFSILASLSKESGIVWFVSTPLIGLLSRTHSFSALNMKNPSFRRFFLEIGISMVFVLIYFFFRTVLLNNPEVFASNSGGRYSLAIFSVSFIKNIFLIFFASFSSVDSAAMFLEPRNTVLLLITIALNIPFMVFLVYRLRETRHGRAAFQFMGIVLLALIVASPHLVISRVAEMHAYPTVFVIALAVGMLFHGVKWKFWKKMAVAAFFVSAMISDTHKWRLMREYGNSVHHIASRLHSQTDGIPEHVLLIQVEDPRTGYSVFWQNPIMGFFNGGAMRPYYNWENPVHTDIITLYDDHTYIESQMKNDWMDPDMLDTLTYSDGPATMQARIDSIVHQNLNKFNCIWIIDGDDISTINNYE